MDDPSNLELGWRSALMMALCAPLLLAAAMLMFRRVEAKANFWLGLFLLVVVIAQVPQIIGFWNFYHVWPGLTFAPFNVELALGPLLYLHADRLMRGGALGWRRWLLLPGAVQLSYYCWAFLALGGHESKWAYERAVHTPYVEPVETLIGLVLLVFAVVAIFRMLTEYRAYLESTQSAAVDFDPVWLRRLLVAIITAGAVFALLEIIPTFVLPVSYVAQFPAQLLVTGIVAWLGFEAVARTNEIFPKMVSAEVETPASDSVPGGRDWAVDGAQLKTAIEQGGWHLEPRLSIRDLAARMRSNETYISKALNQGLGMSFNRFINGLRVETAKAAINRGDISLLEVALESGFNSKATFNRVFRDIAGMTPSQFKASQNR